MDGPGGPIKVGDPDTPGDMHAEGNIFVRPGYEGPEDVDPNAMAGWAALNTKLIELGALDGSWRQNVAPFTRSGQYFNPLILPSWKKRGDRDDYPAIFETHNYIMRLKMSWRQGGGGRSISTQSNMMALMAVDTQRNIAPTDLPSKLPLPVYLPPPNAANQRLPTRSIAVAAAPP
eukprot:6657028-Prymnesium_polylepis.1